MATTVPDLVPLGIGIIVSPLPVAVLIAIALSARARTNALAFTVAAVVATAILTALCAVLGKHDAEGTSAIVRPAQALFGTVFAVVLLVLVYLLWRRRPRHGVSARIPTWMKRLDALEPTTAAALGLALTVPNAKNLPLALEAGALIGDADLPVSEAVLLSVGFALFAGLGLIVLTVLAVVPSKRVSAAFGVVKDELVRHNVVIMTCLLLLLAALQISHVAAALTA